MLRLKKILFSIPFLSLMSCQNGEPSFKSVGNDEFSALIAQESTICLDVRTAAEYASGHIPGSLHADVSHPDSFLLATDSLDRSKTIAVYCRSGKRSKKAARILVEKGHKVVDLDHGINGWMEQGGQIAH